MVYITTAPTAIVLTRDHKPDLEDEKERILVAGSEVNFDGYCSRVVKRRTETLDLNMSRSLGDVFSHVHSGVSAEPEVSERTIDDENQFVLVCSDGIWEVVSPQQAVNVVAAYAPVQAVEAAERLADEAHGRWFTGSAGTIQDDIAVLIAHLHPSHCEFLSRCALSTAAPSQASLSRASTLSTISSALFA